MTNEQLKRGRDIQDELCRLEQIKGKFQYALDHVILKNEVARTYIRVCVPSNSTIALDIKDIDFNKEVLSMYIRNIDLEIVKLEEEFKAL
ncbi:hypothetical protein [Dysgonomonas capnocytophagoides]|uniref:hypothetical protein n=1 Tax=Dysgonomonas capnocytophagoides TaxID=45254 RepID=UPI003996C581